MLTRPSLWMLLYYCFFCFAFSAQLFRLDDGAVPNFYLTLRSNKFPKPVVVFSFNAALLENLTRWSNMCGNGQFWQMPKSLHAFLPLMLPFIPVSLFKTDVCVRAVHAVRKHFWMASPVFRQLHFTHDSDTMGCIKEHNQKNEKIK